jgi:hypothetical protein
MTRTITGTRFICREFHPIDSCDSCGDDMILHDWVTVDDAGTLTVTDCDRT